MGQNMNQLAQMTVNLIKMSNVMKLNRTFNSFLSTTLECEKIWAETEENIRNLTEQFEEKLTNTFESIEKISKEMLDDFIETLEDVEKLSIKIDETLVKTESASTEGGKEQSSSNSYLEKELVETVENGIDISDNVNQLEPYIQEKLEDWLEIDDDDIPLLSMFSKSALAFYYQLGKEYGELLDNVLKVGEEEARKNSGTGVMDKAAIYLYDTEKANATVQQVQIDNFRGTLTNLIDKVKVFKEETTIANDAITQSYADMFTEIGDKIATYQTDTKTANDAVTQSYATMFSNWGTSIETWWTDNVSPYFTVEKWQTLASGMQIGLSNKWLETELWWDENGELSEITVGISDFLEEAIENWKGLLYWWENDKKGLDDLKLGIKIPKFKITFDTKDAYAEIFKLFGLKGTPKFSFEYKKYATGGFPEDGWFRASHGEIMGRFDNGQSVVANNMQITNGIANAVYPAVYDAMMSALSQNGSGGNVVVQIDGREVFKTVRKQANNYTRQTGQPAFNY